MSFDILFVSVFGVSVKTLRVCLAVKTLVQNTKDKSKRKTLCFSLTFPSFRTQND